MKYLAQPQFADNTVEIFEFPYSPTPAITLGPLAGQPNSVLVYQDSSGVTPAFYLFVALVTATSAGVVNVYSLDAIFEEGSTSQNPVPLAVLSLTTDATGDTTVQPVGMAIQPGTGDLYVATTNDNESYGTVNVFSHTRGASDSWGPTGAAPITFNNSGAVAGVASNPAFDRHGNLWLTTFDSMGNYLCCLPVASGFSQYLKLVNGTLGDPGSLLPATLLSTQLPSLGFPAPSGTPSLYPFSGPEGIAFDPAGNLWLANNNDEYLLDVNPKPDGSNSGGGSLVMISSAWLDSLLYPTPSPELNSASGLAVTTSTRYEGASPVTTWYLNDEAQFGGLCFDGYTLYINDENNYNADGAVVWRCDTSYVAGPAAPSVTDFQNSVQVSGVTTTNPGNGSMSIFNYPYPQPTLTVRDIAGDVGEQPDTAVSGGASGVLWESPDILVSNSSDPPAGITYLAPVLLSTNPPTPSFTTTGIVETGSDAWISVRVSNFGAAPSTGTEILRLYYGFASTGLDWPAPWDGSMFYDNQLPLGGVIGEQQLPVIPGLSEMYVQIRWPADEIPDPSQYMGAAGGSVAQAGHFCLLARIESTSVYPFGMGFPEETGAVTTPAALHDNVSNNCAIAWRNIAIASVSGGVTFGPELALRVLGANYAGEGHLVSFGIQTLNRDGEPVRMPGRVVVRAEGSALERLLATEFDEHRFQSLGDGRFQMLDTERGMGKIRLPARELLPFTLQFTPEEEVRDYAVRVLQYLHTNGTERLVGGQTFVFGKVKGLTHAGA